MSEITPEERGTGLSPSSMSLFASCQRRYYHAKVAKTPKDKDFDDDVEALNIGKAFHKCLEVCKHSLAGFSIRDVDDIVMEYGLESYTHTPLIYAMLGRYKQMHGRAGLQAVAFEVPISTDAFFGIVDVVLVDPLSGYWWIGDMKTAASFNPSLIPSLFHHPQLSLYAMNYWVLAKKLGLGPDEYRGCRYRLTTKSKLVRKKDEDVVAYVGRLSKAIKSIDFVLPKEKMNPSNVAIEHMAIKELLELYMGDIDNFHRNYAGCQTYFRPCEYWSQCHGKQFSAMAEIESVSSD